MSDTQKCGPSRPKGMKNKPNPILPVGLDLVEEDEQITHQIQLDRDEKLDVQDSLRYLFSLFFLLR